MKTIILVNIFSLLLLSGCSFLNVRNDLTLEEKASKIKNVTREITALAIREMGKDNNDRQIGLSTELIEITNEILFHVFENAEVPLDRTVVNNILSLVPNEYSGLFVIAYETLNLYYSFPATADVLPPEEAQLLKAFVEGLRAGGVLILEEHGVEIPKSRCGN
ncbi:MAG: hypothetical protein ACXADW_19100 [Candidatus Hodarchaeales archaeon]|jgi:hypothetical protein